MQRLVSVCLAAALVMAPLGAQAADLVVWWEKGYYAQEDEAVREIIAAFEQDTGKQVELVFYAAGGAAGQDRGGARGRPAARLRVRHTHCRLHRDNGPSRIGSWTSPTPSATSRTCSIRTRSPGATLLNPKTGQRALYALPMGRSTNHVHVWKSLLEQAGFTLADIPKEWEAFWAFWCDQVQPAVRKATGRDDIWGVGLPMSGEAGDTQHQFLQFMAAYDADYVTRDGRLVIDDPEVRRRLIEAIDAYTAVYRKGCTPPGSIDLGLESRQQPGVPRPGGRHGAERYALDPQRAQARASGRLLQEHRDDRMAARPGRRGFPDRWACSTRLWSSRTAATSPPPRSSCASSWPRAGSPTISTSPASASCRRCRSCSKAPFWLDPSDPHRMAAVMQIASRPTQYEYAAASGDWRYDLVWQELVWAKAIHRVAAEGISPEQAVDEAIARIKQILAE